ncbi:MAG: hypothetical protein Q9198_008052 [Flavoplaca austrocitrina]
MPHGRDWGARSHALGAEHHGPQDPEEYRIARNHRYPGVSLLLPEPRHLNGWSAAEHHGIYSEARKENDASRDAYETRNSQHKGYVGRLDARQQAYYQNNTGGITPRAHAEMKPLAHTWADDERRCVSDLGHPAFLSED